MSFKEKINPEKSPKHVAIIMDGNGRWAKNKGFERIYGHNQGTKSVKQAVAGAVESGVKFLTLYAFSTENWNRPQDEVNALMELLVISISNELDELNKQNIKLLTIGDTNSLPEKVKNQVQSAILQTHSNTGLNLIIALNYSSRWEILNAIKQIANDVKTNNLDINNINENLFNTYLTTAELPEPELLIRTSGEIRISNFLLWQISYAELYFTPVLWPDFTKEHFLEAIYDYQQRERRFGKTSEQLIDEK